MLSISNRLKLACDSLCTVLKSNAPYDTGNLALNAIRVLETEPGVFCVAIGGELAPYAKYTQEAWQRGTNPNEGWINRGIEEAMPLIRDIMSGAISEDDANDYLQKKGYNKDLEEKQIKRASQIEAQLRKKAG